LDGGIPRLKVDGLTIGYPGVTGPPAVSDVSFSVAAGEQVALIGESGSGKTTLALEIAGLLAVPGVRATSRALMLDGEALDRRHRPRLPRRTPGIAVIFQDAMSSLDPVWTIGSQLAAVLRATERMSRRAAHARAAEWLRRVGLPDTDRVLRARPGELSGGMRQRVMTALALCSRPRLLIADEPTSALDASLARASMDLLTELTADTGASLIIVSHDIHLCLAYSNRLLVMYRGELVEQVASSVAQEHATHPYTIGLLRCVPTLESVGAPALPTLADVMSGAGVTGDTSGPAGRDRQS
jgi:ABC-type glutathione transport system ATPase component